MINHWKLLTSASVICMNHLPVNSKLLVVLLVTPLLRWLLGKGISDLKQIFGVAELSYLQWSVASCPSKIPRPLTYTRKYWQVNTRSLNSYLQTVLTSSVRFCKLTPKLGTLSRTWELILGTNNLKISNLLDCSLAEKWCPSMTTCTNRCLTSSILMLTIQSSASKQTDTTILQQLTIFNTKNIKGITKYRLTLIVDKSLAVSTE